MFLFDSCYNQHVELIYTQTNTHERSTIMSTNKNAYEIRADILSQAQGLLHSRYEKEMHIWEQTRTRDPQTSKIIDGNDGTQPQFPTAQQILDCADQLYSFVEDR